MIFKTAVNEAEMNCRLNDKGILIQDSAVSPRYICLDRDCT